MNTRSTRMLVTAVALSALVALLAGSAQARIPEGNGTKPPSGTVVSEGPLAELLASSAYEPVPVGNGTKPPPGAIVRAQQYTQQTSVRKKLAEIGAWAVPSQKPQLSHQASVREKLEETGYWAGVDPAIKAAIMARSKQATDDWASLDPAIQAAIRARSKQTPSATRLIPISEGYPS